VSNQNGPNWYPSKQFTHTPEVPGAPAPSATPTAPSPARSRMRTTVAALVAGLGSGFLVVLLLLPVSGIDTNPPVCFATFDYTVPCGSGLAFGAALVVGLIVGGATASAGLGRASR
jgi:hypothetical protein